MKLSACPHLFCVGGQTEDAKTQTIILIVTLSSDILFVQELNKVRSVVLSTGQKVCNVIKTIEQSFITRVCVFVDHNNTEENILHTTECVYSSALKIHWLK